MGACCTMPKTPRSSRSHSPEYGGPILEDNPNEETPLFSDTSTGERRTRHEAVDAAPPVITKETVKAISKKDVNPCVDVKELKEKMLAGHRLSSTRAALTGNLSSIEKTKLPKIYICLIGYDKDSKAERAAVEKYLHNKVKIFEDKSIEMVVLNINLHFIYPDGQSALDRLEYYLKGEVGKSTICRILFVNEFVGRPAPPTNVLKRDFEQTLDAATDANKDCLNNSYILNETSGLMRLKPKDIDIVEATIHNYGKAIEEVSNEYMKLADVWSSCLPSRLQEKYSRTELERLSQSDSEHIFARRTFLVRRTIIRRPGSNDPNYQHYFNSSSIEIKQLNKVVTMISEKIDAEHIFNVETLWENLENEENYLKPLCQRLYDYLEKNLCLKSIECKVKIRSGIEDGVRESLMEEIHCHADYCQILAAEARDVDMYLTKIKEYLTSDSSQWLILTEGPDCLLSSIMASAVIRCGEWRSDAHCLFRFVDLTTASSLPEGLFHFLFQHVLLLVSSVKNIHWKRCEHLKNFGAILENATEKCPLVIFIDGVTNLPLDGWEDAFSVLPAKLPRHVKLVVSGSEECLAIKKNAEVIRVKEKEAIPDQPAPASIFSQSGLNDLNASLQRSGTGLRIRSKIAVMMSELEDLFFQPVIKEFFSCLSLAKVGLTDHEGISIFERHYASRHLASMEYICLMTTLRQILRFTVQNGVSLYTWKHQLFKLATELRYLSNGERDVYANLMRDSVLKSDNFSPEAIRNNYKVLQTRCAQEGNAFQIIEKKNYEHPLNLKWLMFTLERCGPFQVIRDINHALARESNKELLKLREFLILSASSLEYEDKQLYTQLHGRYFWTKGELEKSLPKMFSLFEEACKPPISSLLCKVNCLATSIPTAKVYDSGVTYIDGIFRIPGNSSHLVSLSSTKGEVAVWQVPAFRKVRTMIGVNEPKNVKIFDGTKCLLLCGRELRVYNLDNGTLLTKLRELMNQKSPFFGLYHKEHAVTLSRSRMYVNMTNLVTEMCDTTFKVGEDRFLNSLIVCGNGKICVCGDESKKPNSILVWNLETRKLLYDLKMPNHDFNTLIMAITYEGNYLCCVSDEIDDPGTNFVVVYDLQSGTIFKRWKPGRNTKSITISSESNCVIVSLENSSIMAWDLKSGTTRWEALGHTAPVDVLKIDDSGKVLLSWDSTGKDESVRLWDIDTGEVLGVITPDQRITACELSNEGDVVYLGLDGKPDLFCFELTHNKGPIVQKPFGSLENDGKVFDLGQAQASK